MPYKTRQIKTDKQRELRHKRKAEFYAGKSCVVCGSTENLQLDHIDPSTKLGTNFWLWSKERREAELAKCQVLCEPHHIEKSKADVGAMFTGSKNPASKLTESDVRTIRSKAANGVTHRQLAKQYGVSHMVIGAAVNRKTWKHVE